MPPLLGFSLEIQMCHFYPLSNASRQERFQKMNRFTENLKMSIFYRKMLHFHNIGHNKKFPKKSKSVMFTLHFNISRQEQFQKNLMNRIRKKLKSIGFGTRNNPIPQFWLLLGFS